MQTASPQMQNAFITYIQSLCWNLRHHPVSDAFNTPATQAHTLTHTWHSQSVLLCPCMVHTAPNSTVGVKMIGVHSRRKIIASIQASIHKINISNNFLAWATPWPSKGTYWQVCTCPVQLPVLNALPWWALQWVSEA